MSGSVVWGEITALQSHLPYALVARGDARHARSKQSDIGHIAMASIMYTEAGHSPHILSPNLTGPSLSTTKQHCIECNRSIYVRARDGNNCNTVPP